MCLNEIYLDLSEIYQILDYSLVAIRIKRVTNLNCFYFCNKLVWIFSDNKIDNATYFNVIITYLLDNSKNQ